MHNGCQQTHKRGPTKAQRPVNSGLSGPQMANAPQSCQLPLAETSLRYPVSQPHRPRQCNKSTQRVEENIEHCCPPRKRASLHCWNQSVRTGNGKRRRTAGQPAPGQSFHGAFRGIQPSRDNTLALRSPTSRVCPDPRRRNSVRWLARCAAPSHTWSAWP